MLALKLLLRNWRSGELKLLTIALILAVAVVSGISIFVERLESSMSLQTSALLGADVSVISPTQQPDEWEQEANKRNIANTHFIRMQSMVYMGDESSMVSLHIAEENYPLRGKIKVKDSLEQTANVNVADGAPRSGAVWVAAEFFDLLDTQLGGKIEVGEKFFTISKLLVEAPEPFSRYPIVMMNRNDLDATGLVMPGSQIRYRWLLASDKPNAIDEFKEWLEPKLNVHQEISDAHSRSNWLSRTLNNSANLLSFSAVISVLLAGVAIAISTRQFVERHIAQVAVKKSLGASAKQIKKLYVGQLMLLGVSASLIGLLCGHFIQQLIADYMLRFFDVELAPTNFLPYLYSLVSGLCFLLFFALPPLWSLPNIPPIKVLRVDTSVKLVKVWIQVLLSSVVVFGLILLFSRSLELTVKVSAALFIVAALSLLLARGVLWLSKKLSNNATGFWRLGLVNLQRRHQHNTLLIAVFSITLMTFVSLDIIRSSYWQDLQQYADQNEINYYLLNINKHEKEQVENHLAGIGLTHEPMFPTIVGRLTHINEKEPSEDQADYWVFKWDIWLTWFDELPESQPLLKGQWWDKVDDVKDKDFVQVSVREDIAERLELKIGDTLQFSIGGEKQKAIIASVRKDSRDGGINVNFVFRPGHIDKHHHVYSVGLNVPPEHKRAMTEFGRTFPTVLVESFDAWIVKTQRILKQALDGVLVVLLLTLACGCMVLIAAVKSSIVSRQQESGLLRAFGSSKKLIIGSVWLEFMMIGFIAGLIAVVSSEVLVHQLQQMMTNVPYQPHFEYWLLVPITSMIFVGFLGAVTCRSTVATPPMVVLREVG